ncbi:MAG: tripartite tricarboxylate transporter substrate binding protein [Variovorax sp.]
MRIFTAFCAGSASDIVARTLAEELQKVFGQPFIVDNKPGASGIIAAEQVAKSSPDGYTLFLSTNTAHSANPFLFKKLPYEPLKDFTPIARVCYFPFVLAVNASLPVASVQELIAYAHDPAHRLSYGYGNSTGQVAGAAFNSLAKLDATAVPYKSTPQALTDLMGNQIGFLFVDLASSQSHLKSNRLRALAVTTERRSKMAPELPTLADSAKLPGFDLAAWVGVLAPAGLPKDITERLSVEINRALASRKVFDKLTALGAEVAPGDASELRGTMEQQLQVWGRKVKEAGIQAE